MGSAIPMLQWRATGDGQWVAVDDGRFAGAVDRQGSHHYVRDRLGLYIGDYRDLSDAQAALTRSL